MKFPKKLLIYVLILIIFSFGCENKDDKKNNNNESNININYENSVNDEEYIKDDNIDETNLMPVPGMMPDYTLNPKLSNEEDGVFDCNVTDEKYGADNTGKEDSTKAIKRAIYDVYDNGGGTVYLPKGKYVVSESITVLPFVTLKGDFVDSQNEFNYEEGTIIVADVKESEYEYPALFTLGGSSGVVNLIIYYPNQDIDDVKEYPYTFDIPGNSMGNGYYMLQSIINCTVINGYRGLSATKRSGVHEMMTIENFKGTFLKEGIVAYNQADVGTLKNISISNKYWANAKEEFNPPNISKLDEYTYEKLIGLTLGDLEWTQFANIDISNCAIGINVVKGKRIEFAGSLYDLEIDNCKIGLKIDSIDERWGMLVAKGSILRSKKAIINNTNGFVKLAGVEIDSIIEGDNIIINSYDFDDIDIDYYKKHSNPKGILYNVLDYEADNKATRDTSGDIQKALDAAEENGGGIVYMPAGFYRLDRSIVVPPGVELKGASSVANRDQHGLSLGTLILAYNQERKNESQRALITLDGDNSGVRGLRFIYPKINPSKEGMIGEVKPHAFTIRGKGNNVYVENVGFMGVYDAMDFSECDDFFVKKAVGTFYNSAIYAKNSIGGHIEGILHNGNAVCRIGLSNYFLGFQDWVKEANIFDHVINPITRKNLNLIVLENSKNQTILNTFAYGPNTLIRSIESEVVALNVGADNIDDDSQAIYAKKGAMTIINLMRYNGVSYRADKMDEMKIINRASINEDEDDVLIN